MCDALHSDSVSLPLCRTRNALLHVYDSFKNNSKYLNLCQETINVHLYNMFYHTLLITNMLRSLLLL